MHNLRDFDFRFRIFGIGEVNRSMHGGVVLVFAHFRSGDVSKSGKKIAEVWRAIPSESLL